jgi:hypothetical protein
MNPQRKCIALKCGNRVSDRYLMCGRHWSMVPQDVRVGLWREYFYGVRKKKHPTPEYEAAVVAAQMAVQEKQGGKANALLERKTNA